MNRLGVQLNRNALSALFAVVVFSGVSSATAAPADKGPAATNRATAVSQAKGLSFNVDKLAIDRASALNAKSKSKRKGKRLADVCKNDLAKYCRGIKTGGGRLISCLEKQINQLESKCKKRVVKKVRRKKEKNNRKNKVAGATPKTPSNNSSYVRAPASSPPSDSSGSAGGVDPAIAALNLSGAAKEAAIKLKAKYPEVVFTSGRRDSNDQARAMAGNVVSNRSWIKQTYGDYTAARALQAWVDQHPEATTKSQIQAGLYGVLKSLSDAHLSALSRHLSGRAFDVRPVHGGNAEAIKAMIRTSAGIRMKNGQPKFLTSEGGKEIWHAEFE